MVENWVNETESGTQPEGLFVLKNAWTWFGNTVIVWVDVSTPHSLLTVSVIVYVVSFKPA